ncbi:MAG: 4-amino-4-deoxy-L-arabinose transferase [Arachnia sp.]
MTTLPTHRALVQLLAQAQRATSEQPKCRIVGVDGPSGAGKTTFANSLAEMLQVRTGVRPQIVHMDDLYPGWDGLAEAAHLVVTHVLEPLSRGEDAVFERWDWLAGARAETVHVPLADWIVLEGVGSGSRLCRPHLAALAWVEADRDIRMARGIERDGGSFRPHWERWAVQEERLFTAEDTRAHATVLLET